MKDSWSSPYCIKTNVFYYPFIICDTLKQLWYLAEYDIKRKIGTLQDVNKSTLLLVGLFFLLILLALLCVFLPSKEIKALNLKDFKINSKCYKLEVQ